MQYTFSSLLLVFCFLGTIPTNCQGPDDPNWEDLIKRGKACTSSTCQKSVSTCECYLTIEHRLTMMDESIGTLLRPSNGQFSRFDNSKIYSETEDDDFISADGYGSRIVIAVNRLFPGPPIIAYENQEIIIHMWNKMHTDSTTIHFHGIHQKASPWADGVAFVTQCPILPGQIYTVRFNAKPFGTNFYHAHIGDQRSAGLYGPLIIIPRKLATISQPQDDNAGNVHIITIQDWNHYDDPETLYQRSLFGVFDLDMNKVIETTADLSGAKFSRFHCHSGLINGKGRFYSTINTHNSAPLTMYDVSPNSLYRFRVISAATLYPFRVFVEGHRNISIVASDGFEIKAIEVESFIIHPGERIDFILRTDRGSGNYLIVAETIEKLNPLLNQYHAAEAIIHYTNTHKNYNPVKASVHTCSSNNPCIVFNCPYLYHPRGENRVCLNWNNVTTNDPNSNIDEVKGKATEMFFNFAFPGDPPYTPGSVNGREFLAPTVAAYAQWNQVDQNCGSCTENTVCRCTYYETIQKDKVYQFVLTNIGAGAGWSHPIHLHGHSFYVMRMGFASYDRDSGYLKSNGGQERQDIICNDLKNFCNVAQWRNVSWRNANHPFLNWNNPPQKDTIIVPTGGYVVIRFKADNPGLWFFHCHVDLHNTNGMGMMINEALSDHTPVPDGFPTCKGLTAEKTNTNTDIESDETEIININRSQDKFEDPSQGPDDPNWEDLIKRGKACTSSTCQKSVSTCECYLTIEHRLTMMDESIGTLLRPSNGQFSRFDNSKIYNETEDDDFISADGYGSRIVIAVNRLFPGPPIIAYENQEIIIHMWNKMHTDSTTIHFHGIHQKASPWADGVAFVTQCPILPGQIYTVRFNAKPFGTNFYHAHIGDQRSAGLYGPLIIIPRKLATISQPQDDNAGNVHIITIQDWNHYDDPETLYQRSLFGVFDLDMNKVIETTADLSGAKFSRFHCHSGLINGKGRFYSTINTHNSAPLTMYDVSPNSLYRFRVISAATLYPFRVFVEGHRNISIVASDGFEIKAIEVESFIIHPGERIDFILRTDRGSGNYLIVAETIEKLNPLLNQYHAAEAIIHYTNTHKNYNPVKASVHTCSSNNPCIVFNCPYLYHPRGENRVCLNWNNVTTNDPNSNIDEVKGKATEMFFNFAFPGDPPYTPGSVNGREFLAPTVAAYAQWNQVDQNCGSCTENTVCRCTYYETIQKDKVYQFVLTNIGAGAGWSHPIHLHGHSFYVMRMGFASYDRDSGYLKSNGGQERQDIICNDLKNFCNAAQWRNVSWRNANHPFLNWNNPPQKDTIIVPTGGYVVIRFKADNPGLWFFHCHVDLHNTNGMGMMINEALSDHTPVPDGFPTCKGLTAEKTNTNTDIDSDVTENLDINPSQDEFEDPSQDCTIPSEIQSAVWTYENSPSIIGNVTFGLQIIHQSTTLGAFYYNVFGTDYSAFTCKASKEISPTDYVLLYTSDKTFYDIMDSTQKRIFICIKLVVVTDNLVYLHFLSDNVNLNHFSPADRVKLSVGDVDSTVDPCSTDHCSYTGSITDYRTLRKPGTDDPLPNSVSLCEPCDKSCVSNAARHCHYWNIVILLLVAVQRLCV